MSIDLLKCPSCGAPLPPGSFRIVTCEYCKATVTGIPFGAGVSPGALPPDPVADRWHDSHRLRVAIAGSRYIVLGRLARGEASDVFLGRTDSRLTELVVIKVLRALGDQDLLAREWQVLEQLSQTRAQGADYFARMLPQGVARADLTAPDGQVRPAAVYRWKSGFLHTFDDVAREHGAAIDPRAAVWMWKRVLEMLGWIHRAGFVHGAVLPQHLIVHPRDHGVALVGYSCAAKAGSPLPALCAASERFYPREVWSTGLGTPAADIAMSARCVSTLLGCSSFTSFALAAVPAPLAALLGAWSEEGPLQGRPADAWEVKAQLDKAAVASFGPSKYHPFEMPGWSSVTD